MLTAWDNSNPSPTFLWHLWQETFLTWDILSDLHCNLMTSHWQLSLFLHFSVSYQIQSGISLGKCGIMSMHVLQLHLFGLQTVGSFI